MRLSGSLAAAVVGLALAGCDARSLTPDGGGGGAGGGAGAGGLGVIAEPEYDTPVSTFEDIYRATVMQVANRHGYWYTYHDGSADCAMEPPPHVVYVGEAPPTPSPGPSGGLALHGRWIHCGFWGAGVGADFNVPFTSALFYSGPKLAYDVTPYTGITFWAMATPGTSNRLRVKFPMRATTPVGGGGLCDEAMVGQFQCGDDWGADFDLPINGAWRQITVRFGQASFAQEGWGLLVPWNPREVTGVQIQASDANVAYDFWIDDVHLTH